MLTSLLLVLTVGQIAATDLDHGGPPQEVTAETQAANKRDRDLIVLRQRLPEQMATAKLADEQRQKVLALLDLVMQISGRKVRSAAEQELQARDFLARGGELRDLLEELGLPDPGDLLPPGPRSRLGISFGEAKSSGRALVVRILPQYRADKMGMQVGDQILSLNGVSITPKNLIETVVKAKRPYVIEVLRNGVHLTLNEPKN